jgi:hypothetical protein
MSQYYGKYAGKVINNVDPEQAGRMMVTVPSVTGDIPVWAMPSVPYAGMQTGFYAIPPPQANVWIEYEGGNSEKPIWSGCFWGKGEAPAMGIATVATIPHIAMQTGGQTVLLLSDMPGPTGGIMLKTATGAMILINDTGITISNGKGATIQLVGKSVAINDVAFVVT